VTSVQELTLNNTDPLDVGEYQCTIRNAANNATIMTTLNGEREVNFFYSFRILPFKLYTLEFALHIIVKTVSLEHADLTLCPINVDMMCVTLFVRMPNWGVSTL